MRFEPKSASLIAGTAASSSAPPRNPVIDALTARERDVLSMISQGLSNKRVARALEISPETVKSHVKSIFLKLAVSTRAEAVFRAGPLGLLQDTDWASKESAAASSETNRFAPLAAQQLLPAEEQRAARRKIFEEHP